MSATIQEKNNTREILMNFLTTLDGLDSTQMEFREDLWGSLVDHIRVDSYKSSTVVFRGGLEITV